MTYDLFFQGMADEYLRLHPRGSAVVTQFQSRPEILVRVERNHRPTCMSYADAIFSPTMPRPTSESIRYFRKNVMSPSFLRRLITLHDCISKGLLIRYFRSVLSQSFIMTSHSQYLI
jgi:hypothetical protein